MNTPTADIADAYIRTHDLTREQLVAKNASLHTRLEAMRAERDAAQLANRKRSLWGTVLVLCNTLTRRES